MISYDCLLFHNNLSGKPFLCDFDLLKDHVNCLKILLWKKDEKLEMIDKVLPFLNFVSTQVFDHTILMFIIYFM